MNDWNDKPVMPRRIPDVPAVLEATRSHEFILEKERAAPRFGHWGDHADGACDALPADAGSDIERSTERADH